jgi:hypothetical protein
VRKKVSGVVLTILAIFASLLLGSPAWAAPLAGGTLNAISDGVTATGYTSAWTRGTINLRVRLFLNGVTKNDVKNTCYSATNCHNNPTPIVSCGCPGHWELKVEATRPGSSLEADYYDSVITSLVDGKLVMKRAAG